MAWSKLHSKKWLHGSIRKYSPQIRSVWPDLQALAEDSLYKVGVIAIAENVPFTIEQIAKITNTPEELLTEALAIFEREQYITNVNGIITLCQWEDLQSEYSRTTRYRTGTNKSTENATTKSTSKNIENATLFDSVSVLMPLNNNNHQEGECKGGDELFKKFWAAYPRKVAPPAAKRAWQKIQEPEKTLELILAALKWQKETQGWKEGYVPHPATYLNQQRWKDEKFTERNRNGKGFQGNFELGTEGKYARLRKAQLSVTA